MATDPLNKAGESSSEEVEPATAFMIVLVSTKEIIATALTCELSTADVSVGRKVFAS